MRKLFGLILSALFLVAFAPKSVTVELSLKGDGGKVVTICRADSDLYPFLTPDTLRMTPGQSVTIEVPTAKLTTILLSNNDTAFRLIVEPGKSYKLCFERGDKTTVTVDDPVQTLRQQVMEGKSFYKYEFVRDWHKAPIDTLATKLKTNFENLLAADKQRYSGVKMSAEMREFINRDLEAYWMGSLSKVIRADYSKARDKASMRKGFLELWNDIYAKYPTTESVIPSEYFMDFARLKGTCEQANNNNFKKPETFAAAYYNPDYLKTIDNPNIRKALAANLLYLVAVNNSVRDMALIDLIETFLTTYPEPTYAKVFEPFANDLKAFRESAKGDFSAEVKFIENADNITTLDALLTQFKGRPVLIDFWFATCSPCIRNIQKYGVALEKFITANNVVLLCVSVDRDEELWRNTIKANDIKGHHIRAGKDLHADFYNQHNVSMYPHYMLVDAEGKIAIARMKDLSEGEGFYEQLKDALKL